jgi:hypothetical protein
MAKFKIDFKHTLEQCYIATIEAETKEESEKIFDKEPFGHFEENDEEPYNTSGLEIEILEINEIE